MRPTAPPPSAGLVAAETTPPPPRVDVYTTDRPGSDFMVDVLKSLGFEYVAANPGSSFRGAARVDHQLRRQQEPELLTCCHEESSVAMAHGYAKIEGKPMMVMAHGTVGLQHASMAIYNAYADRVPVYIVLGNIARRQLAAQRRRVDAQRAGCGGDGARLHQVGRHAGVARRTSPSRRVRAYKIAMTPPYGPVVLVADAALQEEPDRRPSAERLRVPKLSPTTPPAGDAGAVAELAKMLVAAENPRDRRRPRRRARRRADAASSSWPSCCRRRCTTAQFMLRMNFPTPPSAQDRAGVPVADADVILGLEQPDFFQATCTR